MNVLAAPRHSPPLHDLLGASFVFNKSVTALVWDRDFACFGLADGAVAMLRAHWDGAPKLNHRAGGGIEISAGTAPPSPPAIFKPHEGAVTALAAIRLGGILSGGEDGNVCRLLDGEVTNVDARPRRHVSAVAAGRGGRRAFAAGRNAELAGPDAKRLMMTGAITALAYDPSGLFLAVGFEGGVSLEACAIRNAAKLERAGPHRLLAWRPDGEAIAIASVDGQVAVRARMADDWSHISAAAGPVTSLAFTTDHTLVIAGVDFIKTWHETSGSTAFGGMAARVGIAPIACHPRRTLIAFATADGAILLGKPGTAETMTVRDGGAKVSFMAFSPDGEALAFAAEDGEAGTVMLPDILFRSGESK